MAAHISTARADNGGGLVTAGATAAIVAGAALLLKVALIIGSNNRIPEIIPTVLFVVGMVVPLFAAAGLAAYLGRDGGRLKKVAIYLAIMFGYAMFIMMLSDALGALVEAVTDQKHLIDEIPIAVAGLVWLLAGLSVRRNAAKG